MIDNLTISYEDCGITFTLCMPADNVQYREPFALALMLGQVIKDCGLSEEEVLRELCDWFGYKISKT